MSLPYESVVEGFVSTNFLRKQAEIEAFRREADVTIHKVSELLIVLEIQDSSSTRS